MVNSKVKIVEYDEAIDEKNGNRRLDNGIQIPYTPKPLTKEYECKGVIAIDTETFEGTCRLIAISGYDIDGFPLNIRVNNIYKPSFDDCLRILTFDNNNRKKLYRFFWNIDFDVSAILKLYYKPDKDTFLDYLSQGIPLKYIDHRGVEYRFLWIRGRFFKITIVKSKRTCCWTDLMNFYDSGLDVAGKNYLNEGKVSTIDAEKLNTDKTYWQHKFDIIHYCLKDAELTARLGVFLIKSIKNQNLKLPRFLISNASLAKEYFRFQNFIPGLHRTPKDIIQIAYDCYYGGRFEVFKRGFFNESYLYDIVSEYPDYMRNLPDMYGGVWTEREHFHKLPFKPKPFSFYYAVLDIPDNQAISTIPYKRKDTVSVYPIGLIERWFTWYDLDLMRDFIVVIKKGFEFNTYKQIANKKTKNTTTYPLKDKINTLFNKKQHIDKNNNKMEYNVVKLTMNSLYGCFIERNERVSLDKKGNVVKTLKAGLLFNPIYASHITAYGRWKLLKDIPKEKWNNILAVHTDSIISDIPLDKYLKIGNELGNWQLEAKGKSIIINTGVYQIGNIIKTRGIPKSKIQSWIRFCLKYGFETEKTISIKHMRKIREAIVRTHSVATLNTMTNTEKTISVNSEHKRDWTYDFKDFNDLLKSKSHSLPLLLYNNKELMPNPVIQATKLNIPLETSRLIFENGGVDF